MESLKRLFFLILLLFILPSSACHPAQERANTDLRVIGEQICETLGGKEDFLLADEDFWQSNFGSDTGIKEAYVFLGDGDALREFGVFRLQEPRKASTMKEAIRAYLAREQSSLAELRALYPEGGLDERLALYRDATVDECDGIVYYFVLNGEDTRRALSVLSEKT